MNGQTYKLMEMSLMAEGKELEACRDAATTYVRRHAVDDLVDDEVSAAIILDRIEHYLEVLGLDEATLSGLRADIHDRETLRLRRAAKAKRKFSPTVRRT